MSEDQRPWLTETLEAIHDSLPPIARDVPLDDKKDFFELLSSKLKESYKNGAQTERRRRKRQDERA
jgi:hypothetical protein